MSAGNGTALYRLDNGDFAVVTRRKGDGAFSVGLMKKGEGAQIYTPMHGLKTVDNVVDAINAMQSGAQNVASKATTPAAPSEAPTAQPAPKPEAPASADSVAQKKATVKKKEQKSTTETAKSAKKSETERSEKVSRSPSSNESIAEDFRRRIDAWDGKTEGFSFVIGTTSDAISKIKINNREIGKRQIRIDASKIKKIVTKHKNMSGNVIKQLPDLISRPIVVMESKTVSGRIVMFGEVYDAAGRPIMVALELNPSSRRGKTTLDIIKVANAVGRDNTQNLLNTSRILYWDENKNRVNDWLKVNRLQLPLPNAQSDSAITSISHSAEKVNPKSEKNSAKSEKDPKKNTPKPVENETDASVEDRLRIRIYDKATFDAKEISAARADYKLFDALPDEQRKAILIMRRSAAEAKISDVKVKGLTRMMGAFGFRAVFSPQINSNGFWVHGKNLTVINPNNIYQSSFGHELAHRVEDYAGYDEFAAKIQKLVGKKVMEAAKAQYLADYNAAAEANGWQMWDAEKNADDLTREAVASMVGKYLANANYIDKLAYADKGFIYRAYRAIARMRSDIAVANKIANETELSRFSEYRTVRRMEKVFENALGMKVENKNMRVGISRIPSEKISITVDKAIQNKGDIGEKYNQTQLSPVTDDVAEYVSAASGGKIDLSQKYIALNGDDLWHEYRRRSNSKDEMGRQQIPMTSENLKEAIEAIYAPDVVECVFSDQNNPTQRQSFAYAKKTSDGHYLIVEAIGEKNNPNIVPVMLLHVTKKKWDSWIGVGKSIGEMLYENDSAKRAALNSEFNKKNRVIVAQFASEEAIANTPHSPRLNNSIPDSTQKINPSDEISSEKVSKSVAPNTNPVESRILFGAPAGQQGTVDRVKSAWGNALEIITKKDSRHEFIESLREGMDTFSIYFSNSFAAVETQLRRMAKDGEWDGSYSRMTRQRAQAYAQYVRTAEAKALGMLTMGQFKADGTAYENGGEALLQILEPVLATKGETFEAVDESGNIVTVKAKGGELGGAKYRRISGYLTALNALERAAQGKNPFDSISEAELQGIVAEYEKSKKQGRKFENEFAPLVII